MNNFNLQLLLNSTPGQRPSRRLRFGRTQKPPKNSSPTPFPTMERPRDQTGRTDTWRTMHLLPHHHSNRSLRLMKCPFGNATWEQKTSADLSRFATKF